MKLHAKDRKQEVVQSYHTVLCLHCTAPILSALHSCREQTHELYSQILLFPLHPPKVSSTKQKQKSQKPKNKTPLSVPITPSLGEEAFLGGWTRVGGGESGSGSGRLQSAARFKSKGGERVRSNKHPSKCLLSPNWKMQFTIQHK